VKIRNFPTEAGAGILLSALAMSVGWGIRGDYGHETGAMIPGALLGLSICLGSGRPDWRRRATIMAMCGAIGWAFGGQMSYGRITGYTGSSSLLDVTYGYGCLFLIGGLWAGIGSAVLSLSVTQPRSAIVSGAFRRPIGCILAGQGVYGPKRLDRMAGPDLVFERY